MGFEHSYDTQLLGQGWSTIAGLYDRATGGGEGEGEEASDEASIDAVPLITLMAP